MSENTVQSDYDFRLMADASPVLIWTIDANGLSSFYNKTFLDFIGVSAEEDISDWKKIVHPDDIDATFDTINTAISERKPYSLECRMLRADKKWRWVLAQGNPLLDKNNNFLGFVGSSIDITERKEAETKIEASETSFRNLVEQAPVAMGVFRGSDFVLEVANEKLLQLSGKTKDVLNLPVFVGFPEVVGQGYEALLNGVYNTGIPYVAHDSPLTLIRNGKEETIYVNYIYSPIYNAESKIDGVFTVVTEVTVEVVARKKLEQSEKKFEAAIAAVEGVLWTNNSIGEMEGEQPGWTELTGQTYKEYKGFGWAEMVHKDDAQPTVDAWNKAVKNKEIFEFEHRLLTKEKGWRLFCIKAVPSFNDDGSIMQWVGVHTDITEQREIDQNIIESENQFSTLANNIQNLAWMADSEGYIFWYNQRWFDYTGTSLEEMKGWGWQKVHHPNYVDRIVEFVKQAWKRSEPFSLTFPIRGADGNYRRFLTNVTPVTNAQGEVLRWIGTNTDIEEQETFSEKLEAQVIERTGQLNQANETLNKNIAELEKMNKELKAFTYVSSHDMQEPLRKIQIFSNFIIEKDLHNLSVRGKDYFKRIQQSAAQMQSLIQDLLAFSSLAVTERKFEKIHLIEIINKLKSEFEETLTEKKGSIETSELPALEIIPFQFQQLLHNLISNALKFSKPDHPPRIVIRSKYAKGSELGNTNLLPDGNYYHITIADNGIGFKPEYSEKIFEVFQRLHSKEEYKGTGIGLAIVKKVVENHNGIITAESEVGKGSIFNIYISALQTEGERLSQILQ